MTKKTELPKGFRIIAETLRRGDADDPYDAGTWTYRLDRWETRIVGHWWWKREQTCWWVISRDNNRNNLVQTAYLTEEFFPNDK